MQLLWQSTSTCLNPVWCSPRVSPHRVILNPCCVDPVCVSIELSLNLYGVYSVCIPIEWLSTQCGVDPVFPHRAIVSLFKPAQPSVMLIHCVPIKLLLPVTNFNMLNTLWCWSVYMCLHRAIVNLLQPSEMLIQCGSPELFFNLLQMYIECVTDKNVYMW